MLQVKLHKKQFEVASDTHKYKVIDAGRQFGKSVLARLITLQWATKTPGIYWIVSPTFVQGKQNHWRQLQREIPQEWIVKKNEVELSIQLQNGSIIFLKSAENPDSLRGATINGLIIDEVASIRNWDWLWQEAISGTLVRHDAPVIFISTPKGYNSFYDLFQRGQQDDPIWKSWKFTSYDNPYLRKEVIDEKRKELTEDTFAQEYLADFRKFTGLVYKEFTREVNVIEPFEIPESWSIYRGFDYGSTNPTAWLWIAVDGDDNWFVFDEIYETNQTSVYFAGRLHANKFDSRVVASYGDPSAAGTILEYSQNQRVFITPANKEIGTNFNSWVRFGIEKVSEKLKQVPGHNVPQLLSSWAQSAGMPSLYIFNNCPNTIREFETYRWKEKSVTQAQDLNEPDIPEKANDHALDSLRYFAVSYKGQVKQYIAPKDDISNKNWSFK